MVWTVVATGVLDSGTISITPCFICPSVCCHALVKAQDCSLNAGEGASSGLDIQ